jgi:serine/threonine protein kinase
MGDPESRTSDRFQILRRIGSGGMGVVYEALDRDQGARVALKTLRTLEADAVLLFKNEFRALQDLQHPNLVTLGELISEGGEWFFTMELVEGVDFLSHVRHVDGSRDSPSQPDVSPSVDTLQGLRLQRWGGDRSDVSPRSPSFDEDRLRKALRQLCQGLLALHGAGKVHRDIKPTNILCTANERVVLLDFGLVVNLAAHGDRLSDLRAVGTVAYMAPEQAAAKLVGPEADFYSVGVLLYEALTGQMPFRGSPLEILANKQKFEPTPPRSVNPDVPIDLDALAADLLRFEPSARPSGLDILRRLGGTEAAISPLRDMEGTGTWRAPLFVGRREELDFLREAVSEVRRGSSVIVFVEGESGIGKSALVRQFTEELSASSTTPETAPLILAGRCHERETVPYKAFDAVIDRLSRHLKRLSREEASAILPPGAQLLPQAFPVLARVEALARSEGRDGSGATDDAILDPNEHRRHLFQVLRTLFTRLAERRPLLLVIDDLQWADADSVALLANLMCPPGAPPLLLCATVRKGDAADRLNAALVLHHLDIAHLRVDRLPHDEAAELASRILARRPPGPWDQPERNVSPPDPQAIAREAAGHPLFIDELLRHVPQPLDAHENDSEGGDTARGSPIRLEKALWSRIDRLEPAARRLIEVLAVAGAPLEQELAAEAAAIDATAQSRLLQGLRAANLVRSAGARGTDAIELYHDRVRDAVLGNLEADARRSCHLLLATALQAERGDPEALATHWLGAGEPAKAARCSAEAAAQAMVTLAFDRAGRLYQQAIDLWPAEADPTTLRELHRNLGEALTNAGRGAEAAQAYLKAVAGASSTEAIELRRRSAEQLLFSGHVDEGLDALRGVLAALNIRYPRSTRRAFLSMLWHRLRLALRGLSYEPHDPGELSARTRARVDAAWTAALGLSLVDNIRGAEFQTRHLLYALKAGEPYRVARALALEASYSGAQGERSADRSDHLIHTARTLADQIGDAHAQALAASAAGVTAYLQGRWRPCIELCDAADTQFRLRCTGATWERNTVQFLALSARALMGDLRELCVRVPEGLRDAFSRNDRYAQNNLRTFLPNLAWLVGDDPEGARQAASLALEQSSTRDYHVQHFYELVAQAHIDLYTDRPRDALKRIDDGWSPLKRSLLLYSQLPRVIVHDLHGRAALASALASEAGQRSGLLRVADRCARRLLAERAAWSTAMGTLLRAGVRAARGDLRAAAATYDEAARGFTAAGMALLETCARRRWGELVGGQEGAAAIAASDGWMTAQTVRNPRRMAALMAPAAPTEQELAKPGAAL